MRWRGFLGVIVLVGLVWLSVFLAAPPLSVWRHPLAVTQLLMSEPPARLSVPVADVQPTQLRDTWGAPRSGGRRHHGIDIFVPRGRAILSTTPGIVTTRGQNRLGGQSVGILGPGGQWHYYAHLDAFAPLRMGQWIDAGTLLGYVGNSGNAKGTPPHLHYAIYGAQGGALNPYPLLAAGAGDRHPLTF
ncbi:MAG: M23 family metallopeptidase [Candidatus Competibacteraceae bacterium]